MWEEHRCKWSLETSRKMFEEHKSDRLYPGPLNLGGAWIAMEKHSLIRISTS